MNIVTIAEGDITHLHIGFKGTMNALLLKDLAEKTHRGLPGRIEDGKSAGGLCYGYRVVRTRDFVAGVSPKRIGKNLNREGIASPFGGHWSPSTIYGNAKRGTGILNNELYIGQLVWNRLCYVKDPLERAFRASILKPSGCGRKSRSCASCPTNCGQTRSGASNSVDTRLERPVIPSARGARTCSPD